MPENLKNMNISFTADISDFDFDLETVHDTLTNFVANEDGPDYNIYSNIDLSKLPDGLKGGSIAYIMMLIGSLNISPNRIINHKVVFINKKDSSGNDSPDKFSQINFSFTITNKNLNNPPMPNDFLPASAAGKWFIDYLTSRPDEFIPYDDDKYNYLKEPDLPNTTKPPNPRLYNLENQLTTAATETDAATPDDKKEVFTSNKFKYILSKNEHYTNIFAIPVDAVTPADSESPEPTPGLPPADPTPSTPSSDKSSILDYIFLISYYVFFIGALSFSLIKIMNINLLSYTNNNVLLVLHATIVVFGLVWIVGLFL